MILAKLRCPHAVGEIITRHDDVNPADIWQGTSWERIAGKFLFGADSSHALGSTGGYEEVTLTKEQMPSHDHDRIAYAGNDGWTIGDNTGLGGTQADKDSVFVNVGNGVQNTPMSHYGTSASGGATSLQHAALRRRLALETHCLGAVV